MKCIRNRTPGRRCQQQPPTSHSSSFLKSLPQRPGLNARARDLLPRLQKSRRAIGWGITLSRQSPQGRPGHCAREKRRLCWILKVKKRRKRKKSRERNACRDVFRFRPRLPAIWPVLPWTFLSDLGALTRGGCQH